MFTTIAVLATATCAAALVTGSRVFGLKKIVKHSTKADVAFTAGTAFVLAGTLTGLATAIVAGLLMALTLSFLKTIFGWGDALKRGVDAVKAERSARSAPKQETTSDETCELWVRGKMVGYVPASKRSPADAPVIA